MSSLINTAVKPFKATAFHDGELPAAERARVEEHLRGCPECSTLLADLARVDRAAGVPDRLEAEGPAFVARVIKGFDELAAADPDRWRVVDGVGTVDEVAARVAAALELADD
jgi:anti-sigma factor RsiW